MRGNQRLDALPSDSGSRRSASCSFRFSPLRTLDGDSFLTVVNESELMVNACLINVGTKSLTGPSRLN